MRVMLELTRLEIDKDKSKCTTIVVDPVLMANFIFQVPITTGTGAEGKRDQLKREFGQGVGLPDKSNTLKNAFRKISTNLRMISLVSDGFVDGTSGSHWGWCMVELAKKQDRFEIASGRYTFNTLDGGQDSEFNRLASIVCSAMRDVFRKYLTNTVSGGAVWRDGPKLVRKDNASDPAERIQVPQQTNGHDYGVLSVM